MADHAVSAGPAQLRTMSAAPETAQRRSDAQATGQLEKRLNARAPVVAQQALAQRLNAAARLRTGPAVSTGPSATATSTPASSSPVQRRLLVQAGGQSDVWRQWVTQFASTNDSLAEAINDDAIRVVVLGQADAEDDAGTTHVAWDNAHRRTTIDIVINTDASVPAAGRQETLQHELYLHALPAIIKHYNSQEMGTAPTYLGPDDEGFDEEEAQEHGNRDGWLEMLRNAVATNNNDLRDRVLLDCQSHGNDVAALLLDAKNVGIINQGTYDTLVDEFADEDEDEDAHD